MSASVRLEGLDELRAELRSLPSELATEASGIVIEAAQSAKAAIHYPRRTGKLADGLKVETVSAGQYGAGAVLKNTSKLAHIFENGSQARHTAIGANRGSMPPGHVFVPAAIRARRSMYDRLRALLVRHGATVSGEP